MSVETVRVAVPSSSRPGIVHEVTFTAAPQGLLFRCSCEWASFNRDEPCRHVRETLPDVAEALGVSHPLPPPPGEVVRGAPARLPDDAPAPPSPAAGRRARAAARRPAPRRASPGVDVDGEQVGRDSPAKIRARVDLAALRAVEGRRGEGIELDPLAAATLDRRAAILAEAERTGVLAPPEQTALDVDPVLVDLEARRRAHRTGLPRARRERLPDGTVREVWPRPAPEPEPTPAEAEALRARADRVFDRHGAPKGGAA